MNIYVGIDQSINSTGVTVQFNNEEYFFIITGNNKLTAKERKAHETYSNFNYIQYNKQDTKNLNNHEVEIVKTNNLINISHSIISILSHYIKQANVNCNVYVCMEGISYQSAQTKSIMDLAGLNYIIRYDLLRYFKSVKESIELINEYKLIIAPPGEIKKFASGNGSAKKEIMIKLFETTHPNLYLIPKIDDIADSYWMSEYVKSLTNN